MEKKPQEFALEYAGFWIRVGAALIDFIILASIMYTIYYTIFKTTALIIPSTLFIHIFSSIFWLFHIAYFVGFWIWRGQTPGKIITGIKVIRTDSSPVDWRYALIRYLGCIASAIILFIGFIWIAFDKRKQGLHDKLADTYVVKLPVRQVAFTTQYSAGGQVG